GLLSRAPDIKFEVIDSIPVNNFLTFEEINSAISKNNIQLQIQKENSLIANYKLKEINSLFYPKLNLSSGYNFNRNENQAGFILLNRNLGFVGGVTASWNLFNGGINKRLSKTAKIEIENADLILNSMKLGIDGEILTAIIKKRNFSKILDIEEKNLTIAKEGAQIALEAFRYGSINYVELKETHRNYENIIQKAVNTKLELKRCEIEIMRLTGQLVK
ncbi:MAG: TolC family protein, partial [Bacteroidota bacterium]